MTLFARLNESMYKFPGFTITERPVRAYPFHSAANVLGYLGEVDTNFLKDMQVKVMNRAIMQA